MSADQLAAVEDGTVDADEYREGYRRYVSCVEDGGYSIESYPMNGPLFDYGVPDAAVTSGVDTACYSLEFAQIDRIWQNINVDTSDAAEYLANCLVKNGIEPKDTYAEKEDQLIEAGLGQADCDAVS